MDRNIFAACLRAVREKAPLVQCITNFVTVNDCANILLAIGGSPTMAHDIREVEESVAGVQALVCNLGAIEDVEAMRLAGKKANELGIPVILDPVAAGVTSVRRNACATLLEEVRFTVIRGNASEIRALALRQTGGSGVDVSAADAVTEDTLPAAVALCQRLAQSTGAVVALSGAVDILTDSAQTILLRNGCATMSRITGSGCMLTALLGAFCGANAAPLPAAAAAVAAMDLAGERAEALRLQKGTGNATFRTDLIDAVFHLTEEQLTQGVRYEVYQG